MVKILLWFVSPDSMIAMLKEMVAKLEAHSEAKHAEYLSHMSAADLAAVSEAAALKLSGGLKSLVA